MIERDDNGTIKITDHSSNGTSVEKETLGKGNSKILTDGEHITVFQRQKTASQDQNGPGAVIEYVFRRRDDKPETRAVAQALERQNSQLEADLRKAREEVDKLLGQLREASTSKATLTRDAAEAIAPLLKRAPKQPGSPQPKRARDGTDASSTKKKRRSRSH